MNVTPRLIVNHHHLVQLITRNPTTSIVLKILMNTMRCITCEIFHPMFFWNVTIIHGLKVSERTTLFQKPKKNNNCTNFLFPFQTKSPRTTMFIIIILSTRKKLLVFCKLQVWKHVLPHNTIRFCCFAFAPPNMFLKVVDFGNQKLFSPFDLCAHSTSNHMCSPIKAKKNFCPWKLYCPIILKNLIYFPFFYPSIRITSSNGFWFNKMFVL